MNMVIETYMVISSDQYVSCGEAKVPGEITMW